MRIAFDIGMEDVEAFAKRYMETNKAIKRMKITMISVFAVLLIFSCLSSPIFHSGTFEGLDVFFMLVPIIGIIYVYKFFGKRAVYRMKKDFSNPINSNMFGFCEMILDDEGLKINRTESSGALKWNAIKQLDETPEYFFLYVASSSAHVIPKKKISAEEVGELGILFKKYFTEINVFKNA